MEFWDDNGFVGDLETLEAGFAVIVVSAVALECSTIVDPIVNISTAVNPASLLISIDFTLLSVCLLVVIRPLLNDAFFEIVLRIGLEGGPSVFLLVLPKQLIEFNVSLSVGLFGVVVSITVILGVAFTINIVVILFDSEIFNSLVSGNLLDLALCKVDLKAAINGASFKREGQR